MILLCDILNITTENKIRLDGVNTVYDISHITTGNIIRINRVNTVRYHGIITHTIN